MTALLNRVSNLRQSFVANSSCGQEAEESILAMLRRRSSSIMHTIDLIGPADLDLDSQHNHTTVLEDTSEILPLLPDSMDSSHHDNTAAECGNNPVASFMTARVETFMHNMDTIANVPPATIEDIPKPSVEALVKILDDINIAKPYVETFVRNIDTILAVPPIQPADHPCLGTWTRNIDTITKSSRNVLAGNVNTIDNITRSHRALFARNIDTIRSHSTRMITCYDDYSEMEEDKALDAKQHGGNSTWLTV